MAALVQDVIAEMRKGDERLPAISVGALHAAKADPALLRQVWINLIGNAVKHSAKEAVPRVEIGSTDSDASTATYFVRDNGVGFDMR